ncbi:MAG: translation termination inhibitor protein itt1 [Caeruleum heppii]|nr:MAG: translation termination inhibitor protein itt1 [Caeruleum heppii]
MADDTEFAAEDERQIELSSIAAIFPELNVDPTNPFAASLDLPVTPVTPLVVRFLPSETPFPAKQDVASPEARVAYPSTSTAAPVPSNLNEDIHHLAHLPPLSLHIKLPEGYPALHPPLFKLSTNPDWIPAPIIRVLEADGRRLWEELGKDQVVFTYIDHLQQAAETAFNLADEGACTPLLLAKEMQIGLMDRESQIKREHFERETFNCGVCLDPKRGSACYRLNHCSHVFCLQCLQDFYNNCITEGDVASVKCLDPGCGKDGPQPARSTPTTAPDQKKRRKKSDCTLGPDELVQIGLDAETVKRYVDLKRKARLEADRNTIYCPRKWCQGAARSKRHPKQSDPIRVNDDEESEAEDEPRGWKDGDPEDKMPPPTERVAICEDCSYAFCRVCRAGWHGELRRCWPRKAGELTAEESATAEYMRKYSSPCPTCNAPCQKTMGCNHMICFKCKSHFCYLCSSWLDASNPYQHFNQPGRECFMRLWEMEGGDGLDPGRERRDGLLDEGEAAALELEERERLGREREVAQLQEEIEAHRRHVRQVDQAIVRQRRDLEAVQQALAVDIPHEAMAAPQRDRPRPPPQRVGNGPGRRQGQNLAGRGRPNRAQVEDAVDGDVLRERAQEVQQQGLQRFLRMVELDEEDEWDSDELVEEDGVFGDWEIPVR